MLLLKKAVGSVLLTERMESLAISAEAKSVLRTTLSTVGTYRSAMGMPYYDTAAGIIVGAKSSADVDLTWIGALGIVGGLFLAFFEDGCPNANVGRV